MSLNQHVLARQLRESLRSLHDMRETHTKDVAHLASLIAALTAEIESREREDRQRLEKHNARLRVRIRRRVFRAWRHITLDARHLLSSSVNCASPTESAAELRVDSPQDPMATVMALVASVTHQHNSNCECRAPQPGSFAYGLRVILSAAQSQNQPATQALSASFVHAGASALGPDLLTALCSQLRERGEKQLRQALLPALQERWPNHFGIAFESAALADDDLNPEAALSAWSRAAALVEAEHGSQIAETIANRQQFHASRRREGTANPRLLNPVNRDDYRLWIGAFEDHTPEAYLRWRETAPSHSEGVSFSIVMPTFNPEPIIVFAAIQSVLDQWHPNFELIISDDGSSNNWHADYENSLLLQDSRVHILLHEENCGIAVATNAAIEHASAEWIGFLDQDDLLAPDALAIVDSAASRNSKLQLIFSDEDVIGEDGSRQSPYFKPEAVRELLLGQNVINHFGLYRKGLLRRVGGLREGFEGSQDWDLNLRVVELLQDSEIQHLPNILYHWRQSANSFSMARATEAYASGRRAVMDSLARRGLTGVPTPVAHGGWFQLRLRPRDQEARVSIIVPTRDHPQLIRDCIESILSFTQYPNFDIIIVDNGTSDPRALSFLNDVGGDSRVLTIRRPGPFNFSWLLNEGVRNSTADVVVSLNNDVIVHQSDWLDQLVANALRSDVGAVGPRLTYPDKSVQHAGVLLGIGNVAGHWFHGLSSSDSGYYGWAVLQREVEAVTAACLAVRRSEYLAVGGFDEKNLAVAYNDVDFCLRLRERGLRNLFVAGVELLHLESVSRGPDSPLGTDSRFLQEQTYLIDRWGGESRVVRDRIKNARFEQFTGDALLAL